MKCKNVNAGPDSLLIAKQTFPPLRELSCCASPGACVYVSRTWEGAWGFSVGAALTDERLGAREWTVREQGGSGGLLAGVSGGLEPARV